MFPQLFDFKIVIHTSGKSDYETLLLLSGFRLPLLPEKRVKDAKAEEDNADPWAKYKKKGKSKK
jgi:hypothetical protein